MRPSCSALLSAAGLPALIVTDTVAVRYLTGVETTLALLLASPRGYQLFLDPRYAEAGAATACSGVTVRPLASFEKIAGKLPEIGFDEERTTVKRLGLWKAKLKNTKFVRYAGAVDEFRRTKSEEERKVLQRARKITKEMLRRVPSALRSGVTEKGVAWKLQSWAHELGADGLSFEPIVAFGAHTSRPHHRATTKVLRKGHLVQVDVGVRYRGYCSDLSQVYFTAKATPEERYMLSALLEAMAGLPSLLVPGADSAEVDRCVRAVLKKKGYPQGYPHALGHGVGMEVHEGATLSHLRPPKTLLRDEVFAVEPGLYVEGRMGMRLEDMYVVS